MDGIFFVLHLVVNDDYKSSYGELIPIRLPAKVIKEWYANEDCSETNVYFYESINCFGESYKSMCVKETPAQIDDMFRRAGLNVLIPRSQKELDDERCLFEPLGNFCTGG